jgi:hypothetical protein
MPGSIVADVVSCLVHRATFVGLIRAEGLQKQEAFRAGEGVKASRIQNLLILQRA